MQQEKVRLLKNALSLVRVTVELDPSNSLSFVPVSETLRSMFEKSSFMRGKKRSISPLPRPTT
jgi:hypothetical protein